MPAPKTVYIPVQQHLGRPAVPVVEKGAAVAPGTLIARADGALSSNVFSSVSGVVADIRELATPSGYCPHIVIDNDGAGEPRELPSLDDPSAEKIRDRLDECGVVGMGGAGFPTAMKLAAKEKIDAFIINGAECEPYITCDYRIMLDYTEQFVRGAQILARGAGLDNFVIAIEENKPDAIDRVGRYIRDNKLAAAVITLKTKYPQGAEKQLIYAVTGRRVPVGKLPASVGALVDNVHTALSAYLAVSKGQPLYRRVMTVSGRGIKNPSNIWVCNGTPYRDIIEFCGGESETPAVKMISGGPMMGFAVSDTGIAATKTSGSLLLLTDSEAFTGEPGPCINCAECAAACPMKLMPMYIDSYILAGDAKNAVKYGARNCIECGCCAFVCPAKRPLVQSIRLAKKKAQGGGK
jgi:electron transport complex protein RnfC